MFSHKTETLNQFQRHLTALLKCYWNVENQYSTCSLLYIKVFSFFFFMDKKKPERWVGADWKCSSCYKLWQFSNGCYLLSLVLVLRYISRITLNRVWYYNMHKWYEKCFNIVGFSWNVLRNWHIYIGSSSAQRTLGNGDLKFLKIIYKTLTFTE